MVVKNTPARSAIVDFLKNSRYPVDIDQITKFLRSKNLKTNKVTIYRNMDFFYKNGEVERLEFGEGKFRYELKKNHHHHLVCTKCGRIEEVEGDFLKKMEEQIYKDRGFRVQNHSLEFFGLCKNCLRRN